MGPLTSMIRIISNAENFYIACHNLYHKRPSTNWLVGWGLVGWGLDIGCFGWGGKGGGQFPIKKNLNNKSPLPIILTLNYTSLLLNHFFQL